MKERVHFRIDENLKKRFMEKCQEKGLDSSNLLRAWIQEWIMKEESKGVEFYSTSEAAYQDAEARGEVGLKGSGQTCGPVYFEGHGWTYKTWDNRYLVPGGELTQDWLERHGYSYF